MKLKKKFCLVCALVAIFSLISPFYLWLPSAEAVPTAPGVRRHVQQNGSVVFYQFNGDEFLNFMTDGQGNLIAFGDDGDLYLANWKSQELLRLDSSNTSSRSFIVPTSVKAISVSASSPAPDVRSMSPLRTPIPQYIAEQVEIERRERDEAWRKQHEQSSLQRKKGAFTSARLLPSSVIEKKLLVIYVNFADQDNLGALKDVPLSREYINDLIFNEDNFGTVAHYYKTVTGGVVKIIPSEETYGFLNDGIVEVTISGQHPNPKDDATLAIKMILEPALIAADEFVDKYKIEEDEDHVTNYLDEHLADLSILLIVHGYEASTEVSDPSIHARAVGGVYCYTGAYVTANPPRPITAGAPIHELGHAMFGFKDLYALEGGFGEDFYSYGWGVSDCWSVMGRGVWGSDNPYDLSTQGMTPTALDAYHLSMILPPTREKAISDVNIETHSLNNSAQFMKLTTANPGEYFLLQPRGDVGYDRGFYNNLSLGIWPSEQEGGLLIYHIDENQTDISNANWQTHALFDIEEAHGGVQHLQINGLDGDTPDARMARPNDLFYASKSLFDSTTDPNSNLYDSVSATTQNTVSGIKVADIAATVTDKSTQNGQVEVTFKVGTVASNVPVTGISLNESTLNLLVSDTASLIATITPSNATNKLINWISDNPSIASVNAGLVTANSVGSTTIRAQSAETPEIEVICAVTVTAAAPVITINTQPTAQTTLIQGSITGSLSVEASATQSATLSYQWYSNTTNSNTGGTLIPDATNDSFTIPTNLTAGDYYYYCVVSASRATSMISNIAKVNVIAGGGTSGGETETEKETETGDDEPGLDTDTDTDPDTDPGTDPNTDPGTDPGTDPETDTEPKTPSLEVDTDDPQTPAVIVLLKPDDVTVDETSGTETVSVSEGALAEAIDQAIDVALKAGGAAEPTVEIKVDAVSLINTVKVEIPVSDLAAVVESEVENVKIVTAVGEVTVNTNAIRDIVTQAGSQGSAVVDIAVERKETPLEDNTLTEEQKTVLKSDDQKIREVYDVSVLIDNQKKEFETAGTVTIGLPYRLRAAEGEVADGVHVVYVPENGSTQRMNDARYNETKELAVFTTSHLSVYAITYELDSQDVTPGGGNEQQPEMEVSSGGGCSAGTAIITALLAAAFALIRKSRKG